MKESDREEIIDDEVWEDAEDLRTPTIGKRRNREIHEDEDLKDAGDLVNEELAEINTRKPTRERKCPERDLQIISY